MLPALSAHPSRSPSCLPTGCSIRFGATREGRIPLPMKYPLEGQANPPLEATCWRLTSESELDSLSDTLHQWEQQVKQYNLAQASLSPAHVAEDTVLRKLIGQIQGHKRRMDFSDELWPFILDTDSTRPLRQSASLLGVALLNHRSNFLYALQAKPRAAVLADREIAYKGIGRGLMYAMMNRLEAMGKLQALLLEPVIGSLGFYRRLFNNPRHVTPINRYFPDDPDAVDMVIVQSSGIREFLAQHRDQYSPHSGSADSL